VTADRAARDLRRRLVREPSGSVRLSRSELISSLGEDDAERNGSVDASPAQVAQAVLVHHGIRARPPVDRAGDGETVELAATSRFAVQGALAVTVVAAVAGFVGRPLYALVLGIPAALVAALLWFRPASIDRWVPGGLPRGRLLGAVLAGALVVVAAVAVVLPLRVHYRHQHESASADHLVRDADAAIDAGDTARAKQLLFQAQEGGRRPQNIDDVRAHLIVAEVQAGIDAALQRAWLYDRAVRARAAGRTREALRLLARIPGFRDADQLRAQLRQTLHGG
jgi:hypothetical protein